MDIPKRTVASDGEEQDMQFLHAVYLPSDISDKWEAAPPSTRAPAHASPNTDVGSDGGEPTGGHAPADTASEAAKGRAAADVEHDTGMGGFLRESATEGQTLLQFGGSRISIPKADRRPALVSLELTGNSH